MLVYQRVSSPLSLDTDWECSIATSQICRGNSWASNPAMCIPQTWQPKSQPKPQDTSMWVCLKIGYTTNYSHLIGIMIINHWVYGYTIFRQTHVSTRIIFRFQRTNEPSKHTRRPLNFPGGQDNRGSVYQ